MKESDVLSFNPFEGDFGSPGDKTLHNKMVTARKASECHLCGGKTVPGTRIRTMTDRIEGRIEYYRWCNNCCQAMAKSWYDDGEAYEDRIVIRKR